MQPVDECMKAVHRAYSHSRLVYCVVGCGMLQKHKEIMQTNVKSVQGVRSRGLTGDSSVTTPGEVTVPEPSEGCWVNTLIWLLLSDMVGCVNVT